MTDTKLRKNDSFLNFGDAKQAALNNSLDTEFGGMRTNINTQSGSQLHDNSAEFLNVGNNMTITSSYQQIPAHMSYMLGHNDSHGSLQQISLQQDKPTASQNVSRPRKRNSQNQQAPPPPPLTAEQKKRLEKQRKQAEYKEELENQLRQKKHPLDFRPGELDEIKSHFPEFQRVVSTIGPQRFNTSAKVPGMKISDLKVILKRKMIYEQENPAVDEARIDDLIDKLDRKNEQQINWQEFLKFLDHEGLRREMVNEALLYGMGVKRLKKTIRKSLKETPKQTESYIGNCVYIKHGNTELLLFLFENNQAKIFDAKTLRIVQEIEYTSDYGKPKALPHGPQGQKSSLNFGQTRKQQSTGGQGGPTGSGFVGGANASLKSGSSQPYIQSQKENKSGAPHAINLTQSSVGGFNSQMQSASSNSRRAMSHSQSTKQVQQSFQKGGDSKAYQTANTSADPAQATRDPNQYQRMMSQLNQRGNSGNVGRPGTRSMLQLQKSGIRRPPINARMGGESTDKTNEDLADDSAIQITKQKSWASKGVRPGPGRSSAMSSFGGKDSASKSYQTLQKATTAIRSVNKLETISEEKLGKGSLGLYKTVRPVHLSVDKRQQRGALDLMEPDSVATEISGQRRDKSQILIQKKPEWQLHYERSRKRKAQGQAYGVLGIDPIGSDEEGQQAKMIGKDLKKDDSAYGVKFLLPDLYQDCNKHKTQFDKLMSESTTGGNKTIKGMIKKNKEQLAKVRKEKELLNGTGVEKEQVVRSSQAKRHDLQKGKQRQQDSDSSLDGGSDRENFADKRNKPVKAVHLCGNLDRDKRCKHHKILGGKCQHPPEIQYDIVGKLKKSEELVEKKQAWLDGLQETNKYFYRPNDPSPTKIATYQYHKRQLEKKGIDTTNEMEVKKQLMKMNITPDEVIVSHITGRVPPSKANSNNYCTPEMISKRVEKLKAQEKAKQEAEDMYISKKKDISSYEQNAHARKLRQRPTKSVYCMCAAYNEELGLLALSLIDKEIQIYRIKQNGSKVQFVPHSSFDAKYYTTCMYMERCVANSRPILCMGSNTGEIQIYYLNEYSADQKKFPDGKVKAKQHKCSPFNFFKCPNKHSHDIPVGGEVTMNSKDSKYQVNQTFTSTLNRSARSIEVASQLHTQQTQPSIDGARGGSALQDQRRVQLDDTIVEEEDRFNGEGDHSVLDSDQQQQRDTSNRTIQIDKIDAQKNQQNDWVINFQDFQALEKADQPIQKEAKKPSKNIPLKHRDDIEITSIKYVRDIGLIATSFNGTLKFFDAFEFQEQWCSSNSSRKKDEHTNITVFDISVKLGLMATGGAEGKLILIDPYAQGIMNRVDAHACEILQLYIFDEQQQIITIAQDRSIGLWDARLEKIEVIKDVGEGIRAKKFTSSSFDYRAGRLYVGCQQITVWEAHTDQKVEINALQVKTLSKPILKDRKMQDTDDPSFQPDKDLIRKERDPDAHTGKVLVTNASQLVEIVLNQGEGKQFIITIDSENLLRAWDTEKSITVLSYRILVLGRITAAAVDDTNKYLAVGTSQGEAKVINLKSGGNLYDLVSCQQEISCLQFINGRTEFWLFGACWGGRLMMWTQPSEDNHFTVAAKCKIGHESDIIALDCTPFFVATGDDNGVVAVWNAFSGQLKYLIEVPPQQQQRDGKPTNRNSTSPMNKKGPMSSLDDSEDSEVSSNGPEGQNNRDDHAKHINSSIRRSIVGLCFHPYYQNHICVLLESGNIHIIDGTAGVISHRNVAMALTNSSWACDPYHLRMLVVGDIGRACLYDISMNCRDEQLKKPSRGRGASRGGKREPGSGMLRKSSNSQLRLKSMNGSAGSQWESAQTDNMEEISDYESDFAPLTFFEKHQRDMQMGGKSSKPGDKKKIPLDFRHKSPPKALRSRQANGKQETLSWPVVKNWFEMHKIDKMDPSYVVSVKFSHAARAYVTGTTTGEVRIWDSRDCSSLGTLNSNGWNPRALLKNIKKVQYTKSNPKSVPKSSKATSECPDQDNKGETSEFDSVDLL